MSSVGVFDTNHRQAYVHLKNGTTISVDEDLKDTICRINNTINPDAWTEWSCQGDCSDFGYITFASYEKCISDDLERRLATSLNSFLDYDVPPPYDLGSYSSRSYCASGWKSDKVFMEKDVIDREALLRNTNNVLRYYKEPEYRVTLRWLFSERNEVFESIKDFCYTFKA